MRSWLPNRLTKRRRDVRGSEGWLSACLKLIALERVAAEETNAAVFCVQLQEIKILRALASRRLRELVAAELERAGYEVNLVGPQ